MEVEAPFDQSQFDLFASNLPAKPYCTNDLSTGLRIRSSTIALTQRYIQHNKPTTMKWLVFDCDYPNAIETAYESNLPIPNIAVLNRENGHSHLLYSLECGVHKTDVARRKPLAYLAKIEYALGAALHADVGYANLIVKNPFHNDWLSYQLRKPSYDLNELADYLVLPKKLPRRSQLEGLGRNSTLFELLRIWAYGKVFAYRIGGNYQSFRTAVTGQARLFNDFPVPLPEAEVSSTARSVAKWTWRKYTGRLPAEAFSRIQADRQKKQVAARRQATQEKREEAKSLYLSGKTQREVATLLDTSKTTINRWLAETSQT